MNIYKLVLEYIEQYPEDEPIFIEDIKKYVIGKNEEDNKQENVLKNINVIFNSLSVLKVCPLLLPVLFPKPIASKFP